MSFIADTDSNCVKRAEESKAEDAAVVATTSSDEKYKNPELPEGTRFEKITVNTMCVDDLVSYPRRSVQRASLWRSRTSPWRKSAARGRGGVDVWIAPKSVQKDLRRYVAFLSDRESALGRRMRHSGRRAGYEQGRILLRGALSQTVEGRVLPTEWDFLDGAGKKPIVNNNSARPHFSISHTDSADIVAVCNDGPVGFDAENIFAKSNEIIDLALSPRERRKIACLQKDQQWPAFVRLWTFKEAYTKLVGVGVDVDFSTMEFDLDRPRLVSGPEIAKGQCSGIFETFVVRVDGQPVRMTIALDGKQSANSFRELRICFVTDAARRIETSGSRPHPVFNQKISLDSIGGLRQWL